MRWYGLVILCIGHWLWSSAGDSDLFSSQESTSSSMFHSCAEITHVGTSELVPLPSTLPVSSSISRDEKSEDSDCVLVDKPVDYKEQSSPRSIGSYIISVGSFLFGQKIGQNSSS